VEYQKLSGDRTGEASAVIQQRVEAARKKQRERFSNDHGAGVGSRKLNVGSMDIVCNADMRVGEIRQFCKLDEAGESLIRAAMGQMNLTARGYHRVLKLARTIADLAGSENIQAPHLAEALQYRPKTMMG
jgi:magnesium chelatase family protein